MSELPAPLRELMQEQILGAQNDGVQLGIKAGAKTLQDIAEKFAQDPRFAPDYIRGLRDAVTFLEDFGVHIKETEATDD